MKNLSLIISVTIMFVVTACSKHSFQTVNTESSFSAKAFYNANVDVLWVIDNSYSTMEVHQNRIAQKMSEFYNGLVANQANFRIAATTMNLGGCERWGARGDDGELLGSTPVITKSTPNAVVKMQNLLKRGSDGCNAEKGLAAMKRALEKEHAKGSAAQFLRDDALLVVVFVTDDEDFSVPADPVAKVNLYKNFLDTLKGENTVNDKKWITNYIGVTDFNDPLCTTYGGYSARGEEYMELSNLSGGVVESICNTNFSSYINQINVRLKSVLNKYQLESRPILDSLTVYINGVLIRQDSVDGWVYDDERNMIILNGSAKPGPNDDVEIKYEIKEI